MQQVAGTTGVASVYSSPVFIKVLIRPETASGRDDWSSKSVQQSFFYKSSYQAWNSKWQGRLEWQVCTAVPFLWKFLSGLKQQVAGMTGVARVYNSPFFYKRSYQGCQGPWKSWKVLELAKENSRPRKVLEFGLQSLKILEWAKCLTFNSKLNQNELFVTTGHNIFDVTMYENKNGAVNFPQKQIL